VYSDCRNAKYDVAAKQLQAAQEPTRFKECAAQGT